MAIPNFVSLSQCVAEGLLNLDPAPALHILQGGLPHLRGVLAQWGADRLQHLYCLVLCTR